MRRIVFLPILLLSAFAICQEPVDVDAPEENRISALASVAKDWTLGGWLDFMYLDGDNRSTYFDVPHIYLYLDAPVSERWRGFIETRYRNLPRINDSESGGEVQVERAYIEYKHSMAFKARFGKYNTPSGLWKQKHWAIMVDSNEKPLLESLHYIPSQSVGVEFFGNAMTGANLWNYSLFFSNGGENANTDQGQDDELGYGGDLSVRFGEPIKIGAFFYHHENDFEGVDPLPGSRDSWLFYSDIDLIKHKLLWRTEYLVQDRENAPDLDGFYSKLKWQFRKDLFLNYRFDNMDDVTSGPVFKHRAHTLTLGYRPHMRVRTRMEFAQHDYGDDLNEDEHSWSVWLGLIF